MLIKKYLFSIFVRGFISFSGFLVFLISANLFGAEGRGVISYGTAVFAAIGIFLSFNLGRAYLSVTNKNDKLKKDLLPIFLVLNIIAILVTVLLSLLFWYFSIAAQSILDFKTMMALAVSSAFYVWSINGNAFFASLQKTHLQEMIILKTRSILILFIIVFYFASAHKLTLFLLFYSLILCAGVVVEMLILGQGIDSIFVRPNLKNIKLVLFESIWPHLDFLGFNLFPLFLILIAGHYLEKAQIGRINFTIQMINFIFLLAITANIRVSSYVSNVGFISRIPQLKKLFWGTVAVSLLLSICVFYILQVITKTDLFKSFEGTSAGFALTILAIPGYLGYQILNPIWLEMKIIKQSAIYGLINAAVFGCLSFIVLPKYNELGAISLFAFFYLSLFVIQGLMFVKMSQVSGREIDKVKLN
ncbi:MAG: hypothetical protein WA160_13115 [Pseudobdellovibrio sp.]